MNEKNSEKKLVIENVVLLKTTFSLNCCLRAAENEFPAYVTVPQTTTHAH